MDQRRDISKIVGLPLGELDKLMARLQQELPEDEDCRRTAPRGRRFRCDVQLEVEHIAGGVTRTLCCTRNISAGGVGLVLGSFLHRGSKVRVTLGRLDGKRITHVGIVAFCRHVTGKVHEAGIAFEKPIDPAMYLSDEETLAKIQEQKLAEAGTVEGRVLHLAGSPAEAALVAHHLQATGLELEAVDSLEMAIKRLQTGQHVAIIVDADGLPGGVLEALKRFQAEGVSLPRIVLTADESCRPEDLQALDAAEVLTKPYAPGVLQSTVGSRVRESGVPADAILSTMADVAALAPLLGDFVRELHEVGERLTQAVAEDSFDEVRAICLKLKGTAAGCGFDLIGDRAADILKGLDSSSDLKSSASALGQLAGMCGRTAVSQPAA